MNLYTLYIRPSALQEIKHLPGHMRQRVKRAVDALAKEPRPPGSIELSGVVLPKASVNVQRLRLDKWRIIYTIHEAERIVDILAVRQRPPYDYGDLGDLLQEIG